MEQIEAFVGDRNRSCCIHCGRWMADLDVTRDHIPSRSLLSRPYPRNLPVVQVCRQCNSGFSLDEEYLVALLGSVLSGSTDPLRQTCTNAARILARNEQLRSRIEKAKTAFQNSDGGIRIVWQPEFDRINRVVLKNARGHAFYEFGEPMLNPPTDVWSVPLDSLGVEQRKEFEDAGFGSFWPEVGSRMLTRVLTGQDLADGWVVVQDGVYRYAATQVGVMRIRTVLFEYLATEVHWDA